MKEKYALRSSQSSCSSVCHIETVNGSINIPAFFVPVKGSVEEGLWEFSLFELC